MGFQFECECGAHLSGDAERPTSGTFTCGRCGAVYAVTITQLSEGSDRAEL